MCCCPTNSSKDVGLILSASGFFAKAIQHEYDHLEGVLYIDKATDMQVEE